MKGKLKIHAIRLETEIECDDEKLKAAVEKILHSNTEHLEAVMAQAVCAEIERLVPGLKTRVTGMLDEGDEWKPSE